MTALSVLTWAGVTDTYLIRVIRKQPVGSPKGSLIAPWPPLSDLLQLIINQSQVICSSPGERVLQRSSEIETPPSARVREPLAYILSGKALNPHPRF